VAARLAAWGQRHLAAMMRRQQHLLLLHHPA
jgi:hypothetical protein